VRAVIYTRISQDKAGDALGVARQREACEALCERNGWRVVARLEDNDQSAYSRKVRRGYCELLRMAGDGEADVLVAWAADRLTRRLGELVALTDVCQRHGVEVATVQTGGRVDLTTPAGRLNANMLGAVAEYESAHRGARVKAKHAQLREAGKALRGGTRPYGYEADRVTIRPEEADVVRRMAADIAAGAGPGQVAGQLTREGVPTATGAARWTTATVRRMLMAARVAGFREDPVSGELYPAEWPAILDEATWRHVRAALARRSTPRTTPRTYLLTGGLARCGLCGHPLHAAPQGGKRAMACLTEKGGCGRVAVLAEPVEAIVAMAALEVLEEGAMAKALGAELGASRAAAEAAAKVADIEAHRAQVVADYGHRVIDRATFTALLAAIDADLDAARTEAGRPNATAVLEALGEDVEEGWARLANAGDHARQRALLGLVVAEVRVAPHSGGPRNRFQPERITIVWAD
jgi:site-specific DNA recombinase